jgi:hypothetical protein
LTPQQRQAEKMRGLIAFDPGGYAYLPGGFQYSAAVTALPGWEIERARFAAPVPLEQGFKLIEAHLASIGRSPTALCACELRSPEPMTEAVFVAFNRSYVQPLESWGLFRNDANPVARCNLCPETNKPDVPSFYAFCYTVPATDGALPRSFATSGAAECPDRPNYRDNIVRIGETSPDALTDKLRFAIGDLESRFSALGVSWADVLDTRLYTVHDLHHAVADEFGRRGALAGGLSWHLVRPPVKDIEIEIDARAVRRDIVIAR